MMRLLAVGAGGFLGACLRWSLAQWAERTWGGQFPVGTLAVNTLGCLALGVFMGLVEETGAFSEETRLFVAVGVLGAFTTFSTFGYETLRLMRDGHPALALGNALANVLLGLGAVWVGWAVVRLLQG